MQFDFNLLRSRWGNLKRFRRLMLRFTHAEFMNICLSQTIHKLLLINLVAINLFNDWLHELRKTNSRHLIDACSVRHGTQKDVRSGERREDKQKKPKNKKKNPMWEIFFIFGKMKRIYLHCRNREGRERGNFRGKRCVLSWQHRALSMNVYRWNFLIELNKLSAIQTNIYTLIYGEHITIDNQLGML